MNSPFNHKTSALKHQQSWNWWVFLPFSIARPVEPTVKLGRELRAPRPAVASSRAPLRWAAMLVLGRQALNLICNRETCSHDTVWASSFLDGCRRQTSGLRLGSTWSTCRNERQWQCKFVDVFVLLNREHVAWGCQTQGYLNFFHKTTYECSPIRDATVGKCSHR